MLVVSVDAPEDKEVLEDNKRTGQQTRGAECAFHQTVDGLLRTDKLNAHRVGNAIFLEHFLNRADRSFGASCAKRIACPRILSRV
jgi:hypothetical protein